MRGSYGGWAGRQGGALLSANHEDVIAVDLSHADFGAAIFAACLVVSVFGGALAWALWEGGREGRVTAQTGWGRWLSTAAFHVGWVGMAMAAVLLVAGLWFAMTSQSADEARASRARSECQQYAKLQKLKGSARDNYVKQCVWASD
jgi:hypothetical protein